MNSFQRGRLGTRHYVGTPILPRGPRKTQVEVTEWTPTMGFLLSLLWNIESPSERRTGGDGTEFPSWSCTGWYGPVEWEKAVNWLPSFKIDPDVQLNVELKDGRALKLEEYQNLDTKDSSQSQPSTFIRISAWIVCIYHPRPGREKNSYVGKIDIEDGGYIEWEFHSISKVPLQPDQVCTGIILGHKSDISETDEPALLILNRLGDKLERIGFGDLTLFFRRILKRVFIGSFNNKTKRGILCILSRNYRNWSSLGKRFDLGSLINQVSYIKQNIQ